VDEELERIKRKKMEEYLRRIKAKKEESNSEREEEKINEVVYSYLTERAPEVMRAAEQQFPKETQYVKLGLYKMIKKGLLSEKIDGGTLLALFRTLGLNVYIETSVKFVEHGKVKSLAEKLSEE